MKKTILLLAIALFFSCSQETTLQDDLVQERIDFSQLKVTLENPISNVVFQYRDKQQLKEQLSSFVENITQESRELLKENEKIKNVVSLIRFQKGQAILVSFAYLDEEGKVIKSVAKAQRDSDPLDEILDGAPCPDGYERIGRCSNIGNTQECIGNHLNDFLSENLSSVGDCAGVQINVGILNTTICGQTC